MHAREAIPRLEAWVKAEVVAWPAWFKGQSLLWKVGPIAFVLSYWAVLSLLRGFRSDHVTIGVLIVVLSYGGRAARVLLGFLAPVLLTGILYDSMRFYSDYIRADYIRVKEPYVFDQHFFGIQTDKGLLTPNEWWQLHTHPVLDFFTGLAYLIFIAVFVITCAWFYFYSSYKGTPIRFPTWIRERRHTPMWSFFWVNMLGYSTYYWYPAAPPWYVALKGLGKADLSTPANQAGCLRFDQLLGTHFFSEFYGRSADVFGAIPSLHVAYPLLAVMYAFRFGTWRRFSVGFYILMCFSAVYLNHHYVLDVIWGSAYAVIIFFAVNAWVDRKLAPAKFRSLAATSPNLEGPRL